MEELEIGDYINDINSYHLHMFDKHDVTTKKLDVIVEKVGKVDANYAAQIEGYCSLLGEYGKKFETVCAMLALDRIGVISVIGALKYSDEIGTLFKNADKVSVVARSTDGAGVLAKHADEAGAWLHGGKVFRYSDETAEAVASGEKLLKESQTVYESFADMMSPDDAAKYLDFLENGSKEGLTSAELAGVEKADVLLVSQKVGYEDVWDLRNVGDALESGKYSAFGEMSEADGVRYRDWNYQKIHEISIHNPNAGSMTLGKYFDGTIESGSYVARAELTGDTYFSLGTQWNDITKAYGLSDKEMFNLFNTRALDDAVRQGKSIRFSQNPLEWKGTALGDEWLYLQSKHGYTRLKKIGDYWYAK